MEHGKEKLDAKQSAGAGIVQACFEREKAEAHGRYVASLIGPREECRAEYIDLRDKHQQFVMLGDDRQAEAVAALMRSMEEEKWSDEFDNVVTTVGKNLALDAFLAGSAYTVVGPYIGLINGSASSAVAADTMASHAAWLEVGGANAPTYTGARKTASWSAAASGSKSLATAASFAITGNGTIGGCFLVLGTGAVATIDSTAGTLYSAGAFTGGSKTVSNGDTLNVTYTASL